MYDKSREIRFQEHSKVESSLFHAIHVHSGPSIQSIAWHPGRGVVELVSWARAAAQRSRRQTRHPIELKPRCFCGSKACQGRTRLE